jgi:hypothetical protein
MWECQMDWVMRPLWHSPSGNQQNRVLTLFLGWGSLACRACNVEQASALAASQTIIMDYSELQFMAEARERGFIS